MDYSLYIRVFDFLLSYGFLGVDIKFGDAVVVVCDENELVWPVGMENSMNAKRIFETQSLDWIRFVGETGELDFSGTGEDGDPVLGDKTRIDG